MKRILLGKFLFKAQVQPTLCKPVTSGQNRTHAQLLPEVKCKTTRISYDELHKVPGAKDDA